MDITIAKPAHSVGILGYKKTGKNENACKTDVNQQNKQAENQSAGSGVAVLAGLGLSSAYTPIAQATMNHVAKLQGKLSKDNTKLLNQAGEKVLETTGLGTKGVKIRDVQVGLFDLFVNPQVKAISNGQNAMFVPKLNEVFINKEKGAALQFHELGHAYNRNLSAIWKVIQQFRVPAMLASFGIMIFAACTKDAVAEEGEELTKAQKTKNFVRHNAGKLAFSTMLPVLAEEGMASIRGCQWAKKFVSSDLAKHVTKTNILAYTTYVGAAVCMGLAAFGAAKIKDHFTAKKIEEAKQNQISVQPQLPIEEEQV